jgi:hypothetical protein
MRGVQERKALSQSRKFSLTSTCSPLTLPLPPREKRAQKLNLLKKGWLAMKWKIWCSSGMETQALAASNLTMVAWPIHPHLTLHHLTPLLWLILVMMKIMKRVEKNMKTTSEAS